MLWILFAGGFIGAFAMFLAIIIEMLFSYGRDWSDVGRYAIRMGIFIVIGLVGFFGLGKIDTLLYKEVAQTGDRKLVSLTDNSEISGNGSGNLFYVIVSSDTDEIYSFYYETNNGSVKRCDVDADNATIYETDDCTPHIVEYTTHTKSKMNKVLSTILILGYDVESDQKTYEIYIPKGTAIRTFSLDAQ